MKKHALELFSFSLLAGWIVLILAAYLTQDPVIGSWALVVLGIIVTVWILGSIFGKP